MPMDTEQHLEAFSALQDLRHAMAYREASASGISASDIVAYARRKGATADLAIERALRRLPGALSLHAHALGQIAQASSWSVAAAADRVTERMVGAWRLEILDESGGFPWLVIHAPSGGAPVTMIELRRPDGSGRRLDLGQPIEQVFQLPLDPGFEELDGLVEWLQDPMTEIHLI